MKKVVVILVVLFLSNVGIVAAQKFAHVNLQELMLALPERKNAEDSLKLEADKFKKDIAEMEAEFKTALDTYSMKVKTGGYATKEAQQKAEMKLNQMQKDIEDMGIAADEKLAMREQELMKPMYDRVKAAITKVSKAQNINYVLDVTQIVVMDGGTDLQPMVKKELGIVDVPQNK